MMRRLLPLAICLILLGCSAQDLDRLKSARDQAAAAVDQARKAESAIKQQLAVLPPADPVRQSLEPKLAQLDALVARAERYVPVLDGAIRSAETGQIDPSLQAAVASIPYGSLALAGAGLVWGLAKHIQAGRTLAEAGQIQTAFQQMVKALDAALPQPTDQQKAAIAGVLDTQAKARAAVVRAA